MRLNEQASTDGLSLVWTAPSSAVLLLGSTRNALALASNPNQGRYHVRTIVSVGKSRAARLVRNAADGAVEHDAWEMTDRFSLSDELDISSSFPPLACVLEAFAAAEKADVADGAAAPAVLVHCDMGHNRSPALVLAFLVSRGLTLHAAYRALLAARPTVDPLPTYRRALCRLEAELHAGVCTVRGTEPWAKHLSELLADAREAAAAADGVADACADEDGGFESAIAVRERAIDALLASDAASTSPPRLRCGWGDRSPAAALSPSRANALAPRSGGSAVSEPLGCPAAARVDANVGETCIE